MGSGRSSNLPPHLCAPPRARHRSSTRADRSVRAKRGQGYLATPADCRRATCCYLQARNNKKLVSSLKFFKNIYEKLVVASDFSNSCGTCIPRFKSSIYHECSHSKIYSKISYYYFFSDKCVPHRQRCVIVTLSTYAQSFKGTHRNKFCMDVIHERGSVTFLCPSNKIHFCF